MPVLPLATKGAEKVARDLDKIMAAAKEQGDAIEDTGGKWSRTDALVQRINRRQEVAQQRYNRLLGETRKAYEGGLGVEEYKKELLQITEEYENQTGKFKKFKEGSDSAFDTSSLVSFAGGFATLGTAVSAVKELITSIRDDVIEAQSAIEGGLGGVVPLVTLAGGDPAKLKSLIASAANFASLSGNADLNVAGDAAFAIEAAGFSDDLNGRGVEHVSDKL
jgi:hypothetical protein